MGVANCLACLAAVTLIEGAPSQSTVKASGKLVECGQTLYVTKSATIEYKLGEAYNAYEACPWIIRLVRAANLQFELLNSGFGPNGKLSVVTLEAERTYPYKLLMSETVVLTVHEPTTILQGTVAVVVFSTWQETDGTGFSLNITSIGESIVTVSPDSVDQIISGNSGIINHPDNLGSYSNNELSTFLFAPQNYIFKYSGFGSIRLQYTERGLEGNCYDTVDVWSYDILYSSWRHFQLICGGVGTAHLQYLQNLALVTFSTDGSGTMDGFGIQYDSCGVNTRKVN